MLAHELRNPLTPIRNAAQILRLAGSQNAATQQAVEMVERQVQHVTRLVDDLLNVSRVSQGKIRLHKEAVDLASVITRAAEQVRPLVDARNLELSVTLPTRPVQVEEMPRDWCRLWPMCSTMPSSIPTPAAASV